MASSLHGVKSHQVQTSPDFSAWTTQATIRCTECSEGAGQIVGTASLLRYIGTVREPGVHTAPASQTPLTGIVGLWVRVLIEEVGGAVTINSVDYAVLWYGIVDAERIVDMAGGDGIQSWTCAGLAAHLTRVGAMEAWCDAVDYTGAYSAFPTLVAPTFNDKDSQGIRSDARTASIDGVTCKIFDAFGATAWNAATAWTAKEALEAILSANGRWRSPTGTTFSGGLTFVLSAGTLLDWTLPTLDINGMTVADMVNAVISPRRGLSWRLTVSGSTATINVRSISASAITVGATTLPAATDTATPTLTDRFIQDVELLEDQTGTYDHIRVVGCRPWVGITIGYDPAGPPAEVGSLQKAWTTTQETAWNSAAGPTTDSVWRSFRLGLKWAGDTFDNAGASGLRQALTLSSGDYTGARTFSSTAFGPTSLLTLETKLPCSVGFGTDKAGPRQECMAFWMPSGQTTWYDLQAESAITSRSISIEECPAVIHLGHADRSANKSDSQQQVNKYNISTAGKLAITIGMREIDPLVVSWTRSSGSWPRTNPRTLTVQMPQAEQWYIVAGTVTGVSAGALTKQSSSQTIRDDTPLMNSWLAFLRAYFGEPARQIQWSNIGTIDHAYGSGATAPAALVTTATLGIGSRTVNAVVTRRLWRLTDQGFGTTYSTERIVPDIDSIR